MVSISFLENFMYKKLNYILQSIILIAREIIYNRRGGKVMKKFIVIILCIFTVALLGCDLKKESEVNREESKVNNEEIPAVKQDTEKENNRKEENIAEKESNNKSSFKVIKPEFYTDNIKSMIDNMKEKRGFIEYVNDGNHYIIIFAGKKSTGGVSIDVLEAYDKGEDACIIIKEKAPGPKELVTQALTYPTIVVKVTKAFKNIEVSTDNGEKFQQLEAGEKY